MGIPLIAAKTADQGEVLADQPRFTASQTEKFAIKRFLDFALKDLDFQEREMIADKPPPVAVRPDLIRQWKTEIAGISAQVRMLKGYVIALREGIDQMQEFHQEH